MASASTGSKLTGPTLSNTSRVQPRVVPERGAKRPLLACEFSDVASAKTSVQSPGVKVSRPKIGDDGLPINDTDRIGLVDRRVASASVEKILRGEAMGREVVWCRSTRDLFRDAGDVKHTAWLDTHLALCKHAEELMEEPILKMKASLWRRSG